MIAVGYVVGIRVYGQELDYDVVENPLDLNFNLIIKSLILAAKSSPMKVMIERILKIMFSNWFISLYFYAYSISISIVKFSRQLNS